MEPVESLKRDHTFIVDGMAYVRQIKTVDLTYREFTSKLLKYIINCGKHADIVFDVYLETSKKM